MKIFCSAGSQGFYIDEIHGATIPGDAVEITAVDHQELLQARSLGKHIVAGPDGRPVAVDPPPPSLEDTRAAKERALRTEGGRRLTAMAAPYREAETKTWDTQQREARAYLADSAAPTPMLSAMASIRGIALAEMVAKVMENVALFETAAGQILGRQQALLDQLAAAATVAEIEAIGW